MGNDTIDRYELLEKTSVTPAGTVWRARDPRLDRDVQLKWLPAEMAGNSASRERLLREAQLASRLHHPSIAQVLDAGETDDGMYVVYRLVEGERLSDRIERGGLDSDSLVRIGSDLAGALAAAHDADIVHGDVRPENVFLEEGGRAVLVDLGLAVATDATLHSHPDLPDISSEYTAPEILRGADSDARSDQYALAALLMACAKASSGNGGTSPAPDIERGLLARALSTDPSERFPSMDEFRSTWESQTIPHRRARIARASGMRRGPVLRLAAAVATVLLVAVVAWRILDEGERIPVDIDTLPSGIVIPLGLDSVPNDEGVRVADQFWSDVTRRLHVLETVRFKAWSTGRRAASLRTDLGAILAGRDEDFVVVAQMTMQPARVSGLVSIYRQGEESPGWTRPFDLEAAELGSLTDELVSAIAAEIADPDAVSSFADRDLAPAPGPQAISAFLRGSDLLANEDRSLTQEAELAFLEALELHPEYVQALVGLGAVHNQRFFFGWEAGAENIERARSYFERALAIDPDFLPAREGLITSAWYDGRAEACLQQGQLVAATARADIDALYVIGRAYQMGGLASRAILFYERVLELDPEHQPAAWYLVPCYSWTLAYEAAAESGYRYIAQYGDDGEVRLHMATAYNDMGNHALAARLFERALVLYDGHPNFAVVEGLVDAYRHLGDDALRETIGRAKALCEDRIRIFPEGEHVRAGLAFLYAVEGDSVAFDALFASRRPVYDTAFAYARGMLELGRPERAAALMREAWARGHFNEMYLAFVDDSLNYELKWEAVLDLGPELRGIHERLLARYRFGLDRI